MVRPTIKRKDPEELDEDLRPLADQPEPDLPSGSALVNEDFIAFGGIPDQLNDIASLSAAGLVIAKQIAELTTAVHTMTFLLCNQTNQDR